MSNIHGNTEMSFADLHRQSLPLVVANIWDAGSAAICQRLLSSGSQRHRSDRQQAVAPVALATSSAALAWSLGFADGDQLPVAEMLAAIQRIQRVITLPLSVDIELGYSDNVDQVAELVAQLCDLGVVGINIEDGNQPVALLCEKIAAIKLLLADNIFVNARTDVWLQGLVPEKEQLAETIQRATLYCAAGADGLFVPGVADLNVCGALSEQCSLPVNIMCGGLNELNHQQPGFYASMGVRRLSFGPSPFLACYQVLSDQFIQLNTGSFCAGEGGISLDYAEMNALFSQMGAIK